MFQEQTAKQTGEHQHGQNESNSEGNSLGAILNNPGVTAIGFDGEQVRFAPRNA
jgi:hypothetical protein